MKRALCFKGRRCWNSSVWTSAFNIPGPAWKRRSSARSTLPAETGKGILFERGGDDSQSGPLLRLTGRLVQNEWNSSRGSPPRTGDNDQYMYFVSGGLPDRVGR